MPEVLVGVNEAASLAGLRRNSIYHYIYDRGLPVAKRTIRGHLLFSPAAIGKWRAEFNAKPPRHTISEANKKKMIEARRKSQEAKRRDKWNETMAVAVGAEPSEHKKSTAPTRPSRRGKKRGKVENHPAKECGRWEEKG